MIKHTFIQSGTGRTIQIDYDCGTKRYSYAYDWMDYDQLTQALNLVHIPNARFIDVRKPQKPLWLAYYKPKNKVFYGRKWYDISVLNDAGIRYSPEIKPLGAAVSSARMATDRPASSYRAVQR